MQVKIGWFIRYMVIYMQEIYTDGSSIWNPGPSWWGVIILNPSPSGHLSSQRGTSVTLSWWDTFSTNNIMELTAVIKAMEWCIENAWWTLPDASSWLWFFGSWEEEQQYTWKIIDREITLFTDSTYVQRWVTEWLETWVKRNRRKSKGGQLVSNVALWQRLHHLLPAFTNLQWKRVKAHVGNKWNERVDDIARGEAEKRIW